MNTLLYPPSIDWELTSLCNHKCIHCYNFWRGLDKENANIPSEDYFNSIAYHIIESRPVSVQITGGEPLIVWHRAKHAIKLLVDSGINVSINTNATLVTDEIAAFFANNDIDAFVSFPCCDKEVFDEIVHCKGAADRAEKGIYTLLAHNVRISLNMVVTKINYPYIYNTAMYVRNKFGVSYFSATKASFPQNAVPTFRSQMLDNEEFNMMLATLVKVKRETGMRVDSAWVYSMCGFKDQEILEQFGFSRKCACGRFNFVIDSYGNMKACGCDSRSYGNILEESFESAILEMNEWHSGELLPEECKSCSILDLCGAGCRSDAYSTYNIRCSMDSTANHKNKDVLRYERGGEKTGYPKNLCVSLNTGVMAVVERDGIRLSLKTNYEFVTNAFWNFINENRMFSIEQLLKASSCTIEDVNFVMRKMLKKGILIQIHDTRKVEPISEGNFSLTYLPYYVDSEPGFVKKYVCNNDIRYSR